jgi:hypothetical protein
MLIDPFVENRTPTTMRLAVSGEYGMTIDELMRQIE